MGIPAQPGNAAGVRGSRRELCVEDTVRHGPPVPGNGLREHTRGQHYRLVLPAVACRWSFGCVLEGNWLLRPTYVHGIMRGEFWEPRSVAGLHASMLKYGLVRRKQALSQPVSLNVDLDPECVQSTVCRGKK